MPVFRFPVLVSEDFNGFCTAQAVGEDVSAFAQTKEAALTEIKEYLQWFYRENWWREPAEFGAATLLEFRVEARPEYKIAAQQSNENPNQARTKLADKKSAKKEKKRVFTGTEILPLRVACVYRLEENNSFFAVLPQLGVEFYFYDETNLKQLAATYAGETLKGLTPLELAKFLPAKNVYLEEIQFNIKRRAHNAEDAKEIATLEQVAEPLGWREPRTKSIKTYERDREIADLIERLTKERANLILLGENGVGKTAILTEAVRQIEQNLASGKITLGKKAEDDDDDDDSETLPRYRFWQTTGARMIAGTPYLGQWEERCETVIAELADIEGVLCAESLLDLTGAGGREPIESVAAFLLPFVARGELRMIIEATPAELDACRRLLPGFADVFQIVRVEQFTAEKALAVLEKTAAVYSLNNSIQLQQGAANLIYRLFQRFLPYQNFPGKTPQFLQKLFEEAKQKRQTEITVENAIQNFVKLTGLPELFLRDEIPLEFADVIAALQSQVIGQSAACETAASLVTTFKTGLNDPNRPLGVLLFVGQTGVGKTELAKALAKFFFGANSAGEERLIRLDMSEYSAPGSAFRLLTNADGQPSDLLQKVRQQPFCLILFDEIEKADAAVFDVLLGLFDEGRLTDRFGRTTNFRSAVIVLTSNIGAETFGSIGFGENAFASFEREAQKFFRPEFFNRLDAVVQFNPLDSQSLHEITEKELRAIARREGLQAQNIKLVWTSEVVQFLAAKGFDPRYGARPLQRTIETLVVAPLAKFLLNEPATGRAVEITVSSNAPLNFKIN